MNSLPSLLASAIDLPSAARAYADAGLAVFPCKPRGKTPLIPADAGGKGFKDASTDPDQIARWWGEYPTANIGIVPGLSGLIVIDIDGPTGEVGAANFGLTEMETPTVETGRGRHLYFRHPGGSIGNAPLAPKLDVRADAGYVMAPPSIHPDGATYTWRASGRSFADLPPVVIELLRGRSPILEGSRNNALASHLGRLRKQGATEEGLLFAAHEFNRTRCSPPLPDTEVHAVARSIAKYPIAGSEWSERIEELNQLYALVMVGGKMRILHEIEGRVVFLSREDFALKLANQFVESGGRRLPLHKVWIESSQRREYNRVVFEPGKTDVQGAYNTWKGWGVAAQPGDWSLFMEHIRDVVCDGNQTLARWVMAWFAQIVREPHQKPGTSLALRGKQGTGKTMVGQIFGRILGSSYRHVSSPRMVTGQFNHHLEGCLLLHADEAFWAGDKAAEGILKDLITNHRQWIERKGLDQAEAANLIRLFVTSNSDWLVPAGMEERRFCVIDVPETRMQNHAYFAAIFTQMEEGGYRALLHFMLTEDFSDVNLRKVPVTNALVEQKLSSLTALQSWLLDLLRAGELPGDKYGDGTSPRAELFDHYIRHSQKRGVSRRSFETMVGMQLKKLVPGIESRDVPDAETGESRACYVFPPLQDCRESFRRLVPGLDVALGEDWSDEVEWKRRGSDGRHDDGL